MTTPSPQTPGELSPPPNSAAGPVGAAAGQASPTGTIQPEAGGAPARTEADRPTWRRDVVLFLSGQTISLFGSMLVQYAIMWHLTLVTQSGAVMAMAALFGFVPQAVVSVFAGVWADRLDRKRMIIAADATIATTTLALALLMLAGHDDLWLVYLTLALRSAGAGVQMPAVTALIPQIVPTAKLMRINGINQTIQSAMMLLAPAVAAAVYASSSIVGIFFVDVATAVVGIGFLLVLTVPRLVRPEGETPGYLTDLVDGVRYVAGHRQIRWMLGVFAVVFLLVVAPSNLTPLMMVRTFGEEVWKLTALELAFSVGMLLGGAAVATWASGWNRVRSMLGATFGFGILAVGMGLSPNMWLFIACMFGVGLLVPGFSTPAMTALQETVEPERQGRVFGFVGIVMALTMPIGMLVFGPLADRVAVQTLLVVTGAAMVVVAATAMALPSGRRAAEEIGAPPVTAETPPA